MASFWLPSLHGMADFRKIGMKYVWQPLMTSTRDDPSDIAKYLFEDNGINSAIQMAQDGIAKAQQDGDNYVLSVWREVKTILRNENDGLDDPES
jgi:hypothetical protein